MRRVLCVVLAVACVACDSAAPTPTPAPSLAAPSIALPLPVAGVIDPAPLIARVIGMKGEVLRADRVTARLVTLGTFREDAGASGSSAADEVWAVAVLGSIRIAALIELPNADCGVYAFDPHSGDVRGFRAGAASVCAPYFDR